MTIGESLRYWLGYRLMMALGNKCLDVALHFAPPGDPPPRPPLPRPPLNLTPIDDEPQQPTQQEFRWV